MQCIAVRTLPGLMLGLLLSSLAGCGPGLPGWTFNYAVGAVNGELNYLSRAVPIEQGLDDPSLTQEQKDKLAFVIRARDYAEQVVGLNVGSSYRSFVNLNGQPLAWNLTASRADAIEPYTWQMPIVGPISYLGFFNHDDLIAERDWLRSIGYDTFNYELDAFSTLGLLPDPVSSSLLKRSLYSLADTVMHELSHNSVWTAQDASFSETMAMFVGRTAGLEFLAHEYGSDSPLLTSATNSYEDEARIDAFLQQIVADVQVLYAQPISLEEKFARREPIFQAARQRFAAEVQSTLHEPTRYGGYATFAYNNAFLLVSVRYNSDPQVFADVYDRNDHNWSATLAVFKEATQSSNPYESLRQYLSTTDTQAGP
jgi:predicted aminopeptidase